MNARRPGIRGGARARSPRRRAAATLILVLVALAGCAAPENMIRRLDEEHAAICRGLADVVDIADRAFGEARLEDREEIVQAKLGPALTFRENRDPALTFPISLRIPLPALERRANIFLRIDTVADALGNLRDAASSLDDNKTVTAAVITRVTDRIDAGLKVDVDWEDGPQAGVRPFLRWELRDDPARLRLEQQFYERTDVGFGWRSAVELDRILDSESFVRFFTSIADHEELGGTNLEHALVYRRSIPERDLAISAEGGVKHNTYNGDPESQTPGAADDPDEGYLRLRVTGKVFRPWIEYEVTPGLYFPWRHGDKLEYGVIFSLRVVYESFLRGPVESSSRGEEGDLPEPPAAGEGQK